MPDSFPQQANLDQEPPRAVVVGISDYQHPDITDLHYAHRDAEAFAGWLQSPQGKNLNTTQLHLLTNQEATAARVFNEIIWLFRESGPQDVAILYFSGHGDVSGSSASRDIYYAMMRRLNCMAPEEPLAFSY